MTRRDASLLRVRGLFSLIGAAESAFVPFLPLLLRARGQNAQAIGIELALMAAVGFAAGPLWGYVADRVLGRERTLALCFAGSIGGTVLLGLAHGGVALAVSGSIAWFFRSPGMPLADALALDRLGEHRRGAYGSVRLWMSASFAAGAVVWGVVFDAFGVGLMAPAYAASTAANLVLVAIVFHRRWPRPTLLDGVRPSLRAIAATPTMLLFGIALFLSFAPYTGTYNFTAVRIAALGGGAVFVGLAAGAQAAAEVPSMILTTRLARRGVRPAHLFAAGAAFYVIVYAVWAVASQPAALAAMRLVAGIGFGLTTVAMVVIVDELVPAGLRATGQAGAKAVSAGLAPVAGSFGGGLVYGYLGPSTLFVVAGVLSVLSAIAARAAESGRIVGFPESAGPAP